MFPFAFSGGAVHPSSRLSLALGPSVASPAGVRSGFNPADGLEADGAHMPGDRMSGPTAAAAVLDGVVANSLSSADRHSRKYNPRVPAWGGTRYTEGKCTIQRTT